MARGVSCRARFGAFRWSRRGYAEAMDAPRAQAAIADAAGRVERACNATYSPHGGEGPGYEARRIQGRLAKGYAVTVSGTPHSINSELKHNRLLAAVESLGK